MFSYLNRRMIVLFFLGFASGLPLPLTAATLQAWYAIDGVNIMTIGLLSMIGQPYIYKFLWAPALDRFQPLRLGRRRGWLLIMQVSLAGLLACMAFFKPSQAPLLLAMIALAVATASATQDIASDAYRTDLLSPEERGAGAAVFTTGYRFALLLASGLGLAIAAKIGWRDLYFLMAGLMGLSMFVTLLAPRSQQVGEKPSSMKKAVIEPFKSFLKKPYARTLLGFIMLYKLTDAFALSLSTTFLLRGLHFTLAEVGLMYKVVGIIATILGSFVGGALLSRMSLYRGLWIFGIAQGLSNALFMLLAMVGKSMSLMVFTVFAEYFCGGLATIAFLALLMSLCDTKYSATQYALLSAVAALGRVYVGPLAAEIQIHLGWVAFFATSVVLMAPALLLLPRLKTAIQNYSIVIAPNTALSGESGEEVY